MRIGVDLGGTNVRAGVVNEGKIVEKIAESCRSDKSEQEVIDHLKGIIRQLVEKYPIEHIGVGVPSVVDAQKGIVYNVTNIPSWKEVHLKEILENEFKIPVSVNNDCNCFAMGEHSIGEASAYKDVVCIAFGTGVGSGIIIDDKLYNGVNTGSGEIGCLPYLEYDYESYCGSLFFTREHGMSGKEAYELAAKGDAYALKVWDEIGHHIGNMLKVALFAYDPSAIVMGGSISKAYTFFEKSMMETLQTFPFPETIKNLKIYVSKIEDIAIFGAAMLK